MDFMKAFMDQNMIAIMGEIVLLANTVMKSLIDKYKMQGIVLALLVLLGRVSGVSGKELFP